MALLDALRPSSRRDRWAHYVHCREIDSAWREACLGAGVGVAVDAPIAGTGHRTPKLTSIRLGPPVSLTVQLCPGMTAGDIARAGRRIAPYLGGVDLRVADRGHGWAVVDVLATDPLADALAGVRRVRTVYEPLRLGVDEHGRDLPLSLVDAAHVVMQGATGSGKSTALYGLLAGIAEAVDVRVTGSDVSGLVLGPLAHRPGVDVALGTGDAARHEHVLAAAVAEMDRRIAEMPAGVDVLPVDAGHPLLLVVVEEWTGLLRVADRAGKPTGAAVRSHLARLLGEGRKAGVRCILATQRAEAALVGGYERGQASHVISFRVDSVGTLRLLHPDATPEQAGEHAAAPAGVGLLTAPGRPLTRFRAPLVSYAEYWAAVAGDRQ